MSNAMQAAAAAQSAYKLGLSKAADCEQKLAQLEGREPDQSIMNALTTTGAPLTVAPTMIPPNRPVVKYQPYPTEIPAEQLQQPCLKRKIEEEESTSPMLETAMTAIALLHSYYSRKT